MAVDAVTALARLRTAAEDGTLDQICERRGVRLLSVFGSALRSSTPGDLDIGVSFQGEADLLGLIDDLTVLTRFDRLDVAVIDGADPVLRARALSGLGLYEREAGQFATEQMAALAEERDTRRLRRLDLEALIR
jgi:predicted nucleotidyltransferase